MGRLLVHVGTLAGARQTFCSHSARVNADWLCDDAVLLALEPRMVCTACGLIGADAPPTDHRTPESALAFK
jgi:hypothetical protein